MYLEFHEASLPIFPSCFLFLFLVLGPSMYQGIHEYDSPGSAVSVCLQVDALN